MSDKDILRDAFKILVGKSEGNKLLARIRSKFESNIEEDSKEIDLAGLDLCIRIFHCVFHTFI